MHNPEISIIIPVYNAEKYIDECMEAILNQTYRDYEIICVNDGSQDKSLEILNKYKEKYPEIFQIYSQENQGQAAARNFGVKKAKGRYIAFIDADDGILNDYLEKLHSAIEESNAEIAVCGYEKFDNTGRIILRRNVKEWDIEFDNGLSHVFQYSPWGKLISREMLIKYDIQFISGEKMEDGPYGIITSSVAKKVVTLDYIGYRYRAYAESTMGGIRENGISTSRKAQKFPVKGIEYAVNKVREVRGEEYETVLEFCILKAIAGFVFVFCRRDDKVTHKEICKFAEYMIKKYFPNAGKNPYIRKRVKQLPLSHWVAVKLMIIMYQLHILYPFARAYKLIFDQKKYQI